MELRVWGARGSLPTPARKNLGIGGNTSCIEISLPDGQNLIFDAGTGIRNLGLSLATRTKPQLDLHIFLTHFHWDHLQGLPYFPPLYSAESTVTFHSGWSTAELRRALRGQMAKPYFPVNFDAVAASLQFEQAKSKPAPCGSAKIAAFALHHPGGAYGYTIDSGGARVVYATDHEHGNAPADERVCEAARGADLLVYDSQFTPEEYPSQKGRGHSTWLEATRIARAAKVKQLLLFHHDPGHDDDTLKGVLRQACQHFPDTMLAVEGTVLRVGVKRGTK